MIKKVKQILIFLIFVLFCGAHPSTKQQKPLKALTIVPVADLLLQDMQSIYPDKNVATCYLNISLEGAKISPRSCARVHQLLFNEHVEILAQKGDEYFIRIPHLFYETNGKKKNCYWTYKKNLTPITLLQKKGIDTQRLPAPIQFCKKTTAPAFKNTITLVLPFFEPKTKRTFSAGTRFVRAKKQKWKNHVAVWILSKKGDHFDLVKIPAKICLDHAKKEMENRRTAFVNLVRTWANFPHRFIPYVWGGCSFTTLNKKSDITHTTMELHNGKKIPIYQHKQKKSCASGFDCTGLVARATHIVGIPYFFKNSTTAARNLKKIAHYQELQEGDLLYLSGHMMIVSDIPNNKIVEARSHWHGFGKLHEAPLEKIFKGIKTYKELWAACKKGEPLHRLTKSGKIVDTKKGSCFLQLPA